MSVLLMATLSQYWIVTKDSIRSTLELSEMRGTLQAATEQERQSFRQEWQNRVGEMTSEERQQYMGSGNKKGQGKESGKGGGQMISTLNQKDIIVRMLWPHLWEAPSPHSLPMLLIYRR